MPPSARAPEPQLGDVLKIYMKSDWKSTVASPASSFVLGGGFLLVMLALVPIWNAAALLGNFNYVYWAGYHVPQWTIFTCVLIVFFYTITAVSVLHRSKKSGNPEQNLLMLTTIFVTLFGLFLLMASLPLSRQADYTSQNLMSNCSASFETHRLYEYSQVLQNMRASPECASKYSVEECAGYQDSPPYTDYLKSMENTFQCAGFCYREPSAPQHRPATTLVSTDRRIRQRHTVTQLSLAAESSEEATAAESSEEQGTESAQSGHAYPPTLFSDANYRASCESMASRDMRYFAGDIGRQTFLQGMYLVLIAVVTGFLKLLGQCSRKG